MFKNAKYQLWHANLAARRALRRGVPAALSGTPKYNAHANDIDFQIEADFIGLMAPGLPQSANDHCLARRSRHELRRRHLWRHVRFRHVRGRILRIRSAQGGRGRPRLHSRQEPVRAGHRRCAGVAPSSIPTTGKRCGSCSRTSGTNATPAPKARCKPFNIDAKLNGAYIALGLLYGGARFRQDHRDRDSRRPGFRLQSRQRRRRPRRDARLQGHSGRIEGRHPRPRRQEIRLHATSPSTRSWTAPRSMRWS